MKCQWDLRRLATAVAAPLVLCPGPPTALRPTAAAFTAAATIVVALAMPLGPFPITQPAGFADGGWRDTAMAKACQQFAQGALRRVIYLNTGFLQALRGPPPHVAGDERIDFRAPHPLAGGTRAGMAPPGQRIGVELEPFGSRIPQREAGGLTIGDMKTGLLAGVVSAGYQYFHECFS
jgi:hypothetical protein